MSKRIRFFMLISVVLAFSVSAAAAQGYPAPDGKAIITRLMTDVLSGGKLELIPEIYAADFVDHSPLGETSGVDGMTAYIGNLRTAFPDMQVETQLLISDADWVAGRFVVTGTFTGELVTPAGSVPGNGGPINVPVHHIWQVNSDGLLQESWTELDNLSFLMQLGVIPAPETDAAETMMPMEIDWSVQELADAVVASNREGIVTLTDTVFNQGNIDAVQAAFAEMFVGHPGAYTREQFAENAAGLRAAMPDLKAEALRVVAEGNWVVFHFVADGTFTEDMVDPAGTIPATGNPVHISNILAVQFDEQGRVTGAWELFDNLALLTQLGVIAP